MGLNHIQKKMLERLQAIEKKENEAMEFVRSPSHRKKILESYHAYVNSLSSYICAVSFWRYESIRGDIKKGYSPDDVEHFYTMGKNEVREVFLSILRDCLD